MAKKKQKQIYLSEHGAANLNKLRNINSINRSNAAVQSSRYDGGAQDPSIDNVPLEYSGVNASHKPYVYKKPEEEKAWYEKAADFITSTNSHILDEVANLPSNLKYTYRFMMDKITSQDVDSDQANIQRTKQELDDIDAIKDYYAKNESLNELLYKRNDYIRNNNILALQQIDAQIADVRNAIKRYDDYFLGEGKTHDVIARHMFDTSKMDMMDKALVNTMALTDVDISKPKFGDGWWNNVKSAVQTLFMPIDFAAQIASNAATRTLTEAAQFLDKANITGLQGQITRNALKNLDYNDPVSSGLLTKLYKGSELNKHELPTSLNRSELYELTAKKDRELNEYTHALALDSKRLKDGKINFGGTYNILGAKFNLPDFRVTAYDPEIPEWYKKEQEANNTNPLTHPLYTFAETASTIGLFKHQAQAVTANGLLSSLGEVVAARMSPGKYAEAINAAVKGGSVALGLNAAIQSRKDETGLEAIQAMGERVLETAYKNGANINQVIKSISNELQRHGIDAQNLSEEQIVKAGIAYNINTGDEAFDKAKSDARKGINKLINANNALAAVDYLQILPFMNYSGKAVKSFVNGGVTKALGKNADKITGFVDNSISRVTKQFLEKDAPKFALTFNRTAKYGKDLVKLLVLEGASEGLEEAQQTMLSNRYKRGEYDNYKRGTSVFSIPELINNTGLISNAALNVLGLNPGDPDNGTDEIRKSFLIGAYSSMMFSSAMGAASNLTSSEDNLRGYIKGLKSDDAVAKMIANNYANAQDQAHISLMYDAYNKGVRLKDVKESLQVVKDNVDEENSVIKKEYIDADIKLAEAAYDMYHNPLVHEMMKASGIKRGSEQHKAFVVEGAKRVVDAAENKELLNSQLEELGAKQNAYRNIINLLLDPALSTKERDELVKQNPSLGKFVQTHSDYFDQYLKAINNHAENVGSRFKTFDDFKSDKSVMRAIKRSKEFYNSKNLSYNDVALSIWNNEASRNELYRQINKKENIDKYQQTHLKTEDSFINNKAIRNYAKSQAESVEDETEEAITAKLKDVFKNNTDRADYAEAAYNSYIKSQRARQDYVSARFNAYLESRRIKQLLDISKKLRNQKSRLEFIKKHTGVDLDIDSLLGTIDGINEQLKTAKEREAKATQGYRGGYSALFEDFMLDDDESFDELLFNISLNSALYLPQQLLSYMYRGIAADPKQIKNAIFGTENKEPTPYDDWINHWEQMDGGSVSQEDSVSALTSDKNQKKLQAGRDAIFKMALDRAKKTVKRHNIARKIIENTQEVLEEIGIQTPESQEQAEQEIVQNEQQEQASDDVLQSDIEKSAEGEAREGLAEKYNHRNKKQKSISERLEIVERQRKAQEEGKDITVATDEDLLQAENEELVDLEQGQEEAHGEQQSNEDVVIDPTTGEPLQPSVTTSTIKDIKQEVKEDKKSKNTESTPIFDGIDDWLPILMSKKSGDVLQEYTNENGLDGKYYITREDTVDEDGNKISTFTISGDVDVAPLTSNKYESHQSQLEEPVNNTTIKTDGNSVQVISPKSNTITDYSVKEVEHDIEEAVEDVEFQKDIDDAQKQDQEVISEIIVEGGNVVDDAAVEVQQATFEDLLLSDENFYTRLSETEDGELLLDGKKMPTDVEKQVRDELDLFNVDLTGDIPHNDLPEGEDNNDDPTLITDEHRYTFISQTMFFDPLATEPMKLTVDGKDVKLNKEIGVGKELAEKLTRRGWLKSTKRYYIVTQSEQSKNSIGDPRDALTVALVIEDNEKCYITALRGLGTTISTNTKTGKTYHINNEKIRREEMLMQGADWDKIGRSGVNLSKSARIDAYNEAVYNKAKEYAQSWWVSQGNDPRQFDRWWSNDPVSTDYFNQEDYIKDASQRKRIRGQFITKARQFYAKPGAIVMTQSKIDQEINQLREFRNQIIDAYLTKTEKDGKIVYIFPNKPRTDVVPEQTVQSNGKIQTQKDEDGINSVYRPVVDTDMDIEELSEKLKEGEISFGLGKGAFGRPAFSISGLFDSQANTKFRGRGLSGKIYWMVDPLSESSDTKIPVMLREEKFDTQVRVVNGKQETIYLNNKKNLKLCLEYDKENKQWVNGNKDGYLPSAAEVILHILMGRFQTGVSSELNEEVAEFFIHSGKNTLLQNQPITTGNLINTFAAKQLYYGPDEDGIMKLHIGMKGPHGGYYLAKFTHDEIFGDSEAAKENKLSAVHAIASQMHWNIDKDFVNTDLLVDLTATDGISAFLKHMEDLYGEGRESLEEYINQTICIAGCPQLSFKLSDFYKIEYGELFPKQFKTGAWLLKNKKLQTDTTERVFENPFVFANGVQVEGGKVAQKTEQIINTSTPTTTIKETAASDVKFEVASDIKFAMLTEQIGERLMNAGMARGFKMAKTDDERKQLFAKLNEQAGPKSHGGMRERIVFRMPDESKGQQYALDLAKQRIAEFLAEYKKLHPEATYTPDSIIMRSTAEAMIKTMWAFKKGMLFLDLYNDGTGNVFVGRNQMYEWARPVSGVYSTQEQKGKLNEKEAKLWLTDKLGIPEHKIVVRDAVMRSMDGVEVFGVTQVVVDKIAGEMVGMIQLSEDGGSGLHYHEAWHYVNLLMHDSKTREDIYRSYVKSHPQLNKKDVTIKEVEEAMAEDFRMYMEGAYDKSMSGKIKKLFNDILDFVVSLFSNRREYRQAFKNIESGKYASKKLDSNSTKQFVKAYQNGAFAINYDVLGASDTITSIESITSHQQVFEAMEAVVNRIIQTQDISTVKAMRQLISKKSNIINDTIDDMLDMASDDQIIDILNVLKKNPEVMRHAVAEAFSDLGIRVKMKKREQIQKDGEPIADDATDKENHPDNVWDIYDLSLSKKDGAAVRAKMFFRSIPQMKREWNGDGTYDDVQMLDKYGSPMSVPFDEVWNKLLENLYTAQSLDAVDKKGRYLETSMMGMIQNLAKTDWFFAAVYDKIQQLSNDGEHGDIELRSQIFSTINSSKPQVAKVQLNDPKRSAQDSYDPLSIQLENFDYEEDLGVVDDKYRVWTLNDSNALKAFRNIPRRWSQTLMTNGMSMFDKNSGNVVVNPKFIESLQKVYIPLKNELSKYSQNQKNKNTAQLSNQKATKLLFGEDGFRARVIQLLNMLGIQADNGSLDMLLANDDAVSPIQQIDRLKGLLTENSTGGLGSIIGQLIKSSNKDVLITYGRSKERQIDEIFNNYPETSDVAKLAIAWNSVHPASAEFSVRGANGETLYPVGQNNFLTDRIVEMQQDKKFLREMQKSPYCRHSLLAGAASKADIKNHNTWIKINAFVGIEDANNQVGADYFGITPMEDYIAKMTMTELDNIILPTMADKKTWYSFKSPNIQLSHDTILCGPVRSIINKYIYDEFGKEHPIEEGENKYQWRKKARNWFYSLDEQSQLRQDIEKKAQEETQQLTNEHVGYNRFSSRTLNIFAGYFMDELNSLIQYYSKEHIQTIVKSPNSRLANFHGKVENGRMQFGGNGGLFRYMYDVFDENGANLNQHLDALFQLQKKIEAGKAKNKSASGDNIYENINIDFIPERSDNLDGFELIREYLENLKNRCISGSSMSNELLDNVNSQLIKKTYQELDKLSKDGPLNLVKYNRSTDSYLPIGLPEHMLDKYITTLGENNITETDSAYDNEDAITHATFSLIANHTVNSIISTIEVEKIFTGDPALYKEKYGSSTSKVHIQQEKNGYVVDETFEVKNWDDVYSDKIKRLGSSLSPGARIRVQYSENELKMDPTLGSTKYTNLVVEDIEIASTYLKEIEENFKVQLLVDLIRTGKYERLNDVLTKRNTTVQNLINEVYFNKEVFNELFNALSQTQKDVIKAKLQLQTNPYKGINVCDAQVFIRPALYRKIRIGLGEWTFDPDESGYSDEIAYQIIENDENGEWMMDSEKAAMVKRFQAYPLKMSYVHNNPKRLSKNTNINLNVLNKQAIFPIFKYQRSTSVGKALYDRMNKQDNELDMISFKSAVKVGPVQKSFVPAGGDTTENVLSKLNEKFNLNSNTSIDYSSDITRVTDDINTLPIEVQDLRYLRMQLNTHAHESEERAIGTQMFKLAFSNIEDSELYGLNRDGVTPKTGAEIRADIMRCINKLTELGASKISARFYKDGKLDKEEVKRFVKSVVSSNGLGAIAESIFEQGGVAAGLTSRTVFENSISSIVNAEVIDINTNGGTAIQQSVFGFAGDADVITDEGYTSFNNGRELKWHRADGSTEVLLSANFFKSVVPKEYQTDYNTMRQWLLDNNIIGDNAKPFGVAYRIPTQGVSSMIAMHVADILPEQAGDLIIVPREFTAQTGSDFDVDKLYIATLAYNNGEKIQEGDEDFEASGYANTLLQHYIDLISDDKNYSNARGSIDVITSMLQDELVKPVLTEKRKGYIGGMDQLLPSFQSLRKQEFSSGKSGIGPFALNITNLALTQYSHLTFNYGKDAIGKGGYDFGDLDAIYGQDDNRISDWLSAMVNANVDVAKDPYVFSLNVNKFTYKYTNFLLRAGKGLSTFTLLAQPLLKDYANLVNNGGGIYGKNLDEDYESSNNYTSARKEALKKVVNRTVSRLRGMITKNSELFTEEQRATIIAAANYFETMTMSNYQIRQKYGEDVPKFEYNKTEVFDIDLGKQSIRDNTSSNLVKVANSLIFQLKAIKALEDMDKYATALSELVSNSRIDTKKFGNTIATQIDYKNTYSKFRYSQTLFTINNSEFKEKVPKKNNNTLDRDAESRMALAEYFDKTFLHDKLMKATGYTKDILKTQLFTATDIFEDIFKATMIKFFGSSIVNTGNGEIQVYNKNYDKNLIKNMTNALDNIMRYNALANYGAGMFDDVVDRFGISPLDFTMNGDRNAVMQRMRDLIYGTSEQKDIFRRVAELKDNLRKNWDNPKYEGLVDDNGDITNELLNFLQTATETKKYKVGRFILAQSQMNTTSNTKRKLVTAFNQLLVSEDDSIRHLAEDLAFYAYYSSYDQNVVNSFFELVPYSLRRQYDTSLKRALIRSNGSKNKSQALSAILNTTVSDEMSNIDIVNSSVDAIIDTISRNYWYDDSIVSPAYLSMQKDGGLQSNGTVRIGSTYDKDSNSQFPIAFTTTDYSQPYIKIRKNGTTFLYKQIGEITRTYVKEGSDKLTIAAPHNIYIMVQKAGIRIGRVNMYELYVNDETPSIYEDNLLPRDAAENLVRKKIDEVVERYKKGKYTLEIKYSGEIPVTRRSSNFDVFKPSVEQASKVGTVRLSSAKDKPETSGQAQADVIINITNSKEPTNVNKRHANKTVNISMNGEDIISKIQNITTEPARIHITTDLADYMIDVTKEEVDLFIKQQLDEFAKLIEDSDNKDEQLTAKKELLNKPGYAESAVRSIKMNNFINDLLQKLVVGGIEIKRLDASIREGKQYVANGIVYASSRNGNLFDVIDKVLFISKDISSKNKKLRTLLKKLNATRKQPNTSTNEVEQLQQLADNLAEQTQVVESIESIPNLPKQETVENTVKKIQSTQLGGLSSLLSSGATYSEVTDQVEADVNETQITEQPMIFDDSEFDEEAMKHCKGE